MCYRDDNIWVTHTNTYTHTVNKPSQNCSACSTKTTLQKVETECSQCWQARILSCLNSEKYQLVCKGLALYHLCAA